MAEHWSRDGFLQVLMRGSTFVNMSGISGFTAILRLHEGGAMDGSDTLCGCSICAGVCASQREVTTAAA